MSDHEYTLEPGLRVLRRVGETVNVDGPASITVQRIDGARRVVLRIDAPPETTILRAELLPRTYDPAARE